MIERTDRGKLFVWWKGRLAREIASVLDGLAQRTTCIVDGLEQWTSSVVYVYALRIREAIPFLEKKDLYTWQWYRRGGEIDEQL